MSASPLAASPNVLLAMDEAYVEFLEKPCDLLPLIREGSAPNLLLMRTFSKIYGLAGLRLGYGIGLDVPFFWNTSIEVDYKQLLDENTYNVTGMSAGIRKTF